MLTLVRACCKYLEQQSAAIDNQDFGSGFGQLDLDNLNFRQDTAQGVATLGGVGTLLMLIPVLIVLAFVIYFFAIVVKFYKQLSYGIRSGEQEGIVLQPYTSPHGYGYPAQNHGLKGQV